MPKKARRQCGVFGCTNFAKDGKSYCEEHLKSESKKYEKYLRGYDAHARYDSRWVKVRNIYIKSHPFCEECIKENKFTKATIVHHIIPVSVDENKKYDLENLESVCASCHKKIHDKLGAPEYKF